jgi:energy-coupling factor transport system permease protein
VFHTWAWVAWLLAAIVPVFILHNPLYLALVLGAAWIVYATLGRTTPVGSSWGGIIKIGLFFLILTIPFNALFIHVGRIVLFRLPEGWPLVGGAITLEAIIAGVVNGLALFAILIVFAAFNAVVDHYQLLRATPAFLFQAGVIISIAITFVPQMVLSGKEIREAQRIRGHRFRGLRDLLPLIMPLLASGLERAIQLAETMEARGFSHAAAPVSHRQTILLQAGTLAALLGLLAGLVLGAFFPDWGIWGAVLIVLGGGSMMAIWGVQGRRVRRTRYRRAKWHWRDTTIVAAGAVVLAVIVIAKSTVPQMLIYSPYPPNSLLPPFDSLVGVTLLLLVLPALLAPRGTEQVVTDTECVP